MKKLTNREVIYGFKDLLDKQELSDEIGYSNRWIYFHLLNYRATLLNQKKEREKLSELNYQTIPFLELEEVPDSDFKCVPPLKCILLKTKSILPSTIHLKSVTSPLNKSGEIFKFSHIDPDTLRFKAESRLPAQVNDTYYYLQNTGNGVYVYVWSNDSSFIKGIGVKAIFYEPHIVESINDCAGNLDPCYNYLEAEFPIDPELLSLLYDKAISSLIRPKSQGTDLMNNNSDDISSGQQSVK